MTTGQPDDAFRPYLLNGERVLWTGHPAQGLRLNRGDTFLIPFSLLWAGFVIFWNVSVWTLDASDWFFRLWGAPFLLVGFYFVIGRFLHDAWWRARTSYGVTDRRILILRGSRLVARDLRALPYFGTDQRPNGSGSIQFEPDNGVFSMAMSRNFGMWAPALADNRFIGLDNVSQVYAIISKAIDRAAGRPGGG